MPASRAPRNRTISLSSAERARFDRSLLTLHARAPAARVTDRIIAQDVLAAAPYLPAAFVDLLVVDPPYNLTKTFAGTVFRGRPHEAYATWLETWLRALLPTLKPNASVYICADWRSSRAVEEVADKYLVVRNRITWEREKGRGAKHNWKNCSEDIWFCTVGTKYTFNLDAVKIKRRVLAPYRTTEGAPKDWARATDGAFRLTHPSNVWTDLTVPFWSMSENTDHPTQKPEKMLAKIILASSNPGDIVLDPFLGSGTTAVVAQKLKRHFVGIEREREYCCIAAKRLALALRDPAIQGFEGGIFLDRNAGK